MHPCTPLSRRNQRGNALFLILIGLILFAMLAYAVTQSQRSGGGTISKETLTLAATRLISNLEYIKQAVVRMTVINKCTDTAISFYGMAAGYGTQPASTSCMIFDPGGGGAARPVIPKEVALMGLAPGDGGAYNTPDATGQESAQGVGSSKADLMLMVPILSLDFCNELNRQLGLDSSISTTYAASIGATRFDDETALYTYDPGNGAWMPNLQAGWPSGTQAACVSSVATFWPSSTGPQAGSQPNASYVLYYVLLPR